MDDTQIVALYWARDEAALAESEQKYGGYCRAIALGILESREDAAECVNDTWLRAWEAMPPRRPSRLDTFLGKLTRNLSLDRWKQRQAPCGRRSGAADRRSWPSMSWRSASPPPAARSGRQRPGTWRRA